MTVFLLVQVEGEKIMLNPFKVEFSNAIDERKDTMLADGSVLKMPPYKRRMEGRKVRFCSSATLTALLKKLLCLSGEGFWFMISF